MPSSQDAFVTAIECVRGVMDKEGVNQSKLGELCDMHRANVSMAFNRGNITVRTLARMLDAMGYELVIKAKKREATQ